MNFGGPAGQIALVHRELVARRRWIDEGRFLHALSFCTLLPGPEAQRLATYVEWLLHGVRGGIAAGLLFVLPASFLILGLSALYAVHGKPAPGAMLDGLGLAESTPGPLIMVTEFVGFLGAFHHPGPLPPLAAGALGAAVATWATFAPCFLWIFAAAPHVERLRAGRELGAALAAVTAAVVGVILDLGVSFAIASLDPVVLSVAAVGFAALRKGGLGMPWVILGGVGVGPLRLAPAGAT